MEIFQEPLLTTVRILLLILPNSNYSISFVEICVVEKIRKVETRKNWGSGFEFSNQVLCEFETEETRIGVCVFDCKLNGVVNPEWKMDGVPSRI